MKAAAMQMMDFFLARVQDRYKKGYAFQDKLDKVTELHALVAAYPDIPADTKDFHVSMHFNYSESEFGGGSWKLRGVQLHGGVLQLTTGWGKTDGMCGSDQVEKPTEDIDDYLAALQTDPAQMNGPFL